MALQLNSEPVPGTSAMPMAIPSTSPQRVHSIESLAQGYNKKSIRTLVMGKSPIRTVAKNKFFKIALCDASGEILATVWNDVVDQFYDMIQVDKVYYISNFSVKQAKKEYNYLKNYYDINFRPDTKITECTDALPVPIIKYDFTPIYKIRKMDVGSYLDVIGVCVMTDLEKPYSKDGKRLKRMTVTLRDYYDTVVELTLWNSDAENFNGRTYPIVLLKGAKLTLYNDKKSLSSNLMWLNPDLPVARKLRHWYDVQRWTNMADRHRISASVADEWITFSEATSKQLGATTADNFSLLGVPTLVFTDDAVYKACQVCHDKLADLGNGLFRCHKCNRERGNYHLEVVLTVELSDPTDSQRVTSFSSEVVVAVLGKSAADILHMVQYEKNNYVATFESIQYQTFVFKLQTKKEAHRGEFRTTVMSVTAVDYKEANGRLIKSIAAVTGLKI